MSTTHQTLENALSIVDQDITKIAAASKKGQTLDRCEASKLTDYIKTLLSVHKEERDALKAESLPTKGIDELEDLAKQALESLGLLPEDEEEPEKETDNEPETADTIPPDEPKG